MESGEKELKQAFEEVTTKNVKTVVTYSKETRALVRKLEERVQHQENTLVEYTKKFTMMQEQISNLQQKLYRGGGF